MHITLRQTIGIVRLTAWSWRIWFLVVGPTGVLALTCSFVDGWTLRCLDGECRHVEREAGTEQVVTGTRLVDETRQSLNKITAVSSEISQLVAAIASAAVAQSKASESVTITMTDVATIAEATSNEASNVSASFTQLLAVAQDLQSSVGQFKVN